MAVLRNQPWRMNIRLQKIHSLSHSPCVDLPLLTFQGCGFENGKGMYNGHGGVLRTEPIIDPFLCLLKEALFSFGFCCESINCSSHNKSPKLPGFGVFNSSSCAPVKSGGTSLYFKSDRVPAIPVHFFHRNPVWTACLTQRQSRKQEARDRSPPLHLHLANRH